eukprot:288326-Chlamydomonas_euryale.AAC.2
MCCGVGCCARCGEVLRAPTLGPKTSRSHEAPGESLRRQRPPPARPPVSYTHLTLPTILLV